MEGFLDSTLLTILVIIVIATILALIRAQKRDRCLVHFDGFHITLTEKDGKATWGQVKVDATGLEVHYPIPQQTPKGFWKQSVLFYKDQYESMDGIYRTTVGLSETQQEARRRYLHAIAHPGFSRRLFRRMRNWMGMIRDALVQSMSLLVGAAKTRTRPGAAVLTRNEQQVSTLSAEIIGHAGNSFDPLLERHLYTRVIIDVTRKSASFSYCGYLADYTASFLEIIDAQVTAEDRHFGPKHFRPGNVPVEGLEIFAEDNKLRVENNTDVMLVLHEIIHKSESVPAGVVIPTGFVASLRLGSNIDCDEIELVIESASRVDMLLPRAHALVRNGVTGLNLEEIEAYR